MLLAARGPLGAFLRAAFGTGLSVFPSLYCSNHPVGFLVVASVLLDLGAFISHVLLRTGEIILMGVASTNKHFSSLEPAVPNILEEVSEFVVLRWLTRLASGVLLLPKDVMRPHVGGHIRRKGEILFPV